MNLNICIVVSVLTLILFLWISSGEVEHFNNITNDLCMEYKEPNHCFTKFFENEKKGNYYEGIIFYPSQNGKPQKCCLSKNREYVDIIGDRNYDNSFMFKPYDINDFDIPKFINKRKAKIVFGSNIDSKKCQNICNKCKLGNCPNNYKCKMMYSHPEINCIIANRNTYNEDNPNSVLKYDTNSKTALHRASDVKWSI
jgi:hypothetical protein